MDLLGSIRHNLAGLGRFSGRDRPGQFWPYAFTTFVVTSAALSLWMQRSMDAIGRRTLGNFEPPPGVPITRIRIEAEPGMFQSAFKAMFIGIAIAGAVVVVLMAAAVARRLHDRGRTGWWGALPVGFAMISLAGMWRLFSQAAAAEPNGSLFFLIFCSNIAYFGSLLYLIVMLAGAGTPGPNEFGPSPIMPDGEA